MSFANRILLILVLTCGGAFAQSLYTDTMYQRALSYQGTSPIFVLITLKDSKNKGQVVCLPAPLLLGAITHENKFGYDETGTLRQMEIATSQPGRIFVFRDPRALDNVAPTYSPRMLAEVKKELGRMTNAELITQVKDKTSTLSNIYRVKKNPADFDGCRDAIAHVLLERGILVGREDISRDLYVVK